MLEFDPIALMPDDDDSELGILPAIAAAIPAAISLTSSIVGAVKGKKSSGGGGGSGGGESDQKAAIDAGQVLGALQSAIGGDSGQTIEEIVKNLIKTIPPPVVGEVKEAIRQVNDAKAKDITSQLSIAKAVDAKFGPQIAAMLAAVKTAKDQRQATYEHDVIVARNKFRENTSKGLLQLAKRLDAIERRLAGSAIVRGSDKISLLGGRQLLER